MSYEKLRTRFDRIATLDEVTGVLHWDLQTMMPSGGAEGRGGQIATMQVLRHELMADPVIGDWLDAAGDEPELSDWDRANLREMRRTWLHATAVEPRLVEAFSRAGTECFVVWQTARGDNDWESFRPSLERVVDLTLEIADAKADALGMSPYDATIDGFEPGVTAAEIETVFAPLRAELPDLVVAVEEAQASAGEPVAPEGPFPVVDQEALARRVMAAVGFDFAHGRLDVSHHPFCGGSPDDVRITTRYRTDDFASALMGVVHETGHAMYERQLPIEWRRQPVGGARGMGMHESQSLLVEMQACRSRGFVGWLAPQLREAFGGGGPAWEPDNLFRLYTRVQRGLIRVDADEVTYPLHVILRFDLERRIFDRDLRVAELPDAWNAEMRSLLGVTPPTVGDGCMQDVHWTDGAFGYFPSYTLGAIAAAQLFQSAVAEHPEIPEDIGRGEFGGLMSWLGTNVHSRASSVPTAEILTDATGRSFDSEAFLGHLRNRYLGS